jgi:metal-sulfur cluster biosynthetic enzyme
VTEPEAFAGVVGRDLYDRATSPESHAHLPEPPAGSPELVIQHFEGSEASTPVIDRLWSALAEVEDPEIPVSLVDMGLIVSLDHEPTSHLVRLKLTYTAMGCPAMEMIQDDIRTRLLQEPDVEHVDIEVVWDPVWTHRRLSPAARRRMRDLGLAV